MCESDWKGGFIGTTFYFSWCLALLFVPRQADKIGRRWLFLGSRLAECGLFFATFFARDYWVMVAIIFWLGVAAAGRLFVGTVLLTEWCTRKHQTGVHIMNHTGLGIILLSNVLFYWQVSNETIYVSVLGYILCIVTTALAFFVPESPRFLVAKGRTAEVQSALNRMAWINRKDIAWTEQELEWISENAQSK